MSQKRIEVGKQPLITITECQGDLIVRSWAETAVLIQGDAYEADESDAGLSLAFHGSARLTVPVASSLSIGDAHGDVVIKKVRGSVSLQNSFRDASLLQVGSVKIGAIHCDLAAKQIDGSLSAETIYGDAAIRECGGLALGTIHGDLSARSVNGMVQINEVMGDISLRTVSGDVTVKQGGRDANLRGLNGKANTLSNIVGDIRLRGPLNPGAHAFTAGGDIVFHWPEGVDLNVTAVASHIQNRLKLEDVAEKDGSLVGMIGVGETAVSLTADGRIALKESQLTKEEWAFSEGFNFDFDFDAEGFSEMINRQVFDQVSRVTADLEAQFGADFSERMAEKVARKAEKAAAKVERAAEKAMRRAERSMRRGWHYRPPRPSRPPKAPKRQASGEEQLKILKMVEKGIISPDEAGTLLEALES